ncbi:MULTISPECIES: HNH endonuclease [Chryseobacterium]|uniref:HNH endonuclease n=1 Tax=Chryseobacterium TaxID=59732 RepID=UPI00129588D9|nr:MULTISPECIES: HNH endonuclease signature motif containing protein [Chryseobacterium]MDR6922480.1 trigger factor [Chryseobacterium sp. 2987]
MSQNRPAIKSSIKREVRQRCGFGCVICGNPIYQYDHLLGWAKVRRHKAEEITLLCSEHHSEKTSKRLPDFIVEEFNKNPYNLRSGITKPKTLYYFGDSANVVFGSMRFSMTKNDLYDYLIPFTIDHASPIKIIFKDQMYLLNIELQDPFGKLILKIVNNELVMNIGLWDIQYVGQRITIRESFYKIFIEIRFETPNTINFIRGKIFIKGKIITIHRENGLKLPCGGGFSNFTIKAPNGFIM